jgi:hypothetical protein
MKIKIVQNNKHIANIKIKDELLYNLNKKEIDLLCKAILWEKWIHPLIKSSLWLNPWNVENEKIKEIMKKLT